jgi:formylglycine-generating enzyme required for sulfatase activity
MTRLALAILCVASFAPAGCARSGQPAAPRFVPAAGAVTDAATGLPKRVLDTASGVELALVPPGEFRMGSPPTEPDRSRRETPHRRVVRSPFYLGRTEVTVAQFRAFVSATGYETDAERGEGEQGKGSFATTPDGERTWDASANWRNVFPLLPGEVVRDDHPVVQVSWNDARRFAEHYRLRLPSEAQWEYAARGGSDARFPWGDSEAAGAGRANVADESRRRRFPATNVYFPFDDGASVLAPVASYAPGAWGLYDMIGNVEEWCEDAVGPYPADGADETAARGPGPARVLRGGSWVGNAGTSRSATRIGMAPASRRDFQGFRVAATVETVRSGMK